MQHIRRKRNSGKTTILLHYMEVNPWTIYVARTTDECRHTMELANKLGLCFQKERFVSAGLYFNKDYSRFKVLLDNADNVIERHPEIGYQLINRASVITTTRD